MEFSTSCKESGRIFCGSGLVKVLLAGAAGQLGQAIVASKPEGVELIATTRWGGDGLLELDLANPESCRAAVQAHQPDWVMNAGA